MYATLVSTFAALASIGALYLHWTRWRHDQRTKSLIVRLQLGNETEVIGGWWPCRITLRSRANTGYTADKIQVLWPPSGEVAMRENLFTENPEEAWGDPVYRAPDNRMRGQVLHLIVAHSGQSSRIHPQGGYRIAYGEKESEDVFLRRSGNGRIIVAINITPEDDSERPFTRIKAVRV